MRTSDMVPDAFLAEQFSQRRAPDGSLVRDNFTAWFGASLATTNVRAGSAPYVLYHGTRATFDVFDPQRAGATHRDDECGPCVYFTDTLSAAKWYAGRTKTSRVLPVYLRMENPRISRYKGAGSEYLAEDIERARAEGHDGVIALSIDDGGIQNQYVIFRPEQVKSATHNCGAFRLDDPSFVDAASLRAVVDLATGGIPTRQRKASV